MLIHDLAVQRATDADSRNDDKVVTVRLRWAEYDALNQEARSIGITNNIAVRIAIRRIEGFLEIDGHTRSSLDAISASIGRVALDLERLGEAAARNSQIDLEALMEQRRTFGAEFRHLDALLRAILNTTRRKADGRMLLKDAHEHRAGRARDGAA